MAHEKGFHVLVATDGSAAAKAALTTAVRFPWPAGARASGVVAKQVPAEHRRSILLAALDQTADALSERAARALARRWPDAAVRVVDASPVDAILREAKRVRADVVVMGWRGHGSVRRMLTGSVSRGVVRRAPCAVLVVRRAARALRRVVVGVDGSTHARRAVALIARLEPPPGARVSLVMAVEPMHVPTRTLVPARTRVAISAEVTRLHKQRLAEARTELDRAARTLTDGGWAVDRLVEEGAPLRELLTTVARTRADVLVVGARGATRIRQLLLGSVAEGALNQSPVPVLIVRGA